MTPLQGRVLSDIIGATSAAVDRHRQFAALQYARSMGIEREFWALFLAIREDWARWQIMTQRKWQAHTRRQSRARHHDSVQLREKYVRMSGP